MIGMGRRLRTRARRRGGCVTGLVLAVSLLAPPGPAAAQGGPLEIREIRIESTPPGAEVYVIGGKAGVTPVTITERDIYPNDYPDDREWMYGKVYIRKPGCTGFSKRLTVDDIDNGVHARLDCAASVADAAPESVVVAAPRQRGEGEVDRTPAQRRLRQLRVLQELLDDGIISADEERAIRRRLLERD